MIQKIDLDNDFVPYARLLNEAFLTVAEEFRLTRENSPTNNAFITAAELKSQLTECRCFYAYFEDEIPIGFVAIERAEESSGTFYIEKLAVHPDFRHAGIGIRMMNFAEERIIDLAGKRVSLGLINSNILLKEWYKGQGYLEFHLRKFDHLPFDVCFMEKGLSGK